MHTVNAPTQANECSYDPAGIELRQTTHVRSSMGARCNAWLSREPSRKRFADIGACFRQRIALREASRAFRHFSDETAIFEIWRKHDTVTVATLANATFARSGEFVDVGLELLDELTDADGDDHLPARCQVDDDARILRQRKDAGTIRDEGEPRERARELGMLVSKVRHGLAYGLQGYALLSKPSDDAQLNEIGERVDTS